MKHDDASWHYGGEGFSEDLPHESGGTHIGMFLGWAIINHLESEMHREQSQIDLVAVRERRMTGRTFLFKVCDEKFCDDDLSDEGNAFAQSYYYCGPGELGRYMDDYADTFMATEIPTEYHVADTWENFDKLAPVITARYEKWKARQSLKSADVDDNVLMIVEALERLQDEGTGSGSFAIFKADDERNIYIQCQGGRGDSELYVESVGNRYLSGGYELSARQIAILQESDWIFNEKIGNFWKIVSGGNDVNRLAVAQEFMRTFQGVYGISPEVVVDVELCLEKES